MLNRKPGFDRKTIRLQNYDYSQPGMYFITICTPNHKDLFGKIEDGMLNLNEYGLIVQNEWIKTSEIRPNVEMDVFVVMPNHFHGIIRINDSCRGVSNTPQNKPVFIGGVCNTPLQNANPLRSPSQTIGAIVRGFKSTVTRQINLVRHQNMPVWQRNYYEHVILDEESYEKISEYIIANPLNWLTDEYFQL
jgi:putative transposase